MEKTTINTFLYMKANGGSTFAKLMDIKSYPDIFSEPEKIDISDLSSKQKKYAEGMVDVSDLKFGGIYDKTTYTSVKSSEGADDNVYQLRFGKNGEYGAWTWTGSHFLNVKGGDVGSAREVELTCYCGSEITEATVSGS